MSERQEKPTQPAASTADEDDNEKDDDSLDTPIGCLRCRKDACRQCCCSLNNYWKSVIWCSIIIVYLFLGGIFFSLAERPAELERVAEVNAANATLQAAREELMASVNNSNLTDERVAEILQRLQNFTAASQRLNNAQEATNVVQVWDFASAVFFCVTVITTIGEKLTTLYLNFEDHPNMYILHTAKSYTVHIIASIVLDRSLSVIQYIIAIQNCL